MTPVTIQTSARGWREVSTTAYWTGRVLWDTGAALYAVVQDTGASPKIRVLKADSRTAPATWTEQDSGDNKTITNVDYPFSSWLHTNGDLHIVGFTATNTVTHWIFDTDTDQWATGYGTVTTAAANVRNLRTCVRSDGDVLVFFTSSADDADLGWARYEGVSWTVAATGILAATSTAAATIVDAGIDSADFAWVVYDNAGTVTVRYRTVSSANSVGTATDIAATSLSHTTAMTGGRFGLYDDSGTDKIIAAYIDGGAGSRLVNESVITLEAASGSGNVATEVGIEGTDGDIGARTPISSAVVGGTPYAAWWGDASSGTLKYSTKSGGTWAAETDFATGITNLIEIVPVGTTLVVVYQSGSDVVMDFIVGGAVGATGTVSTGSLSVSGQAITAQTGVVGTVSTGSLAVSGQSITGTVSVPATGTVSTGSHAVTGQTISATTGAVGTIGTGSLAVSGQTVAATTGVVATIGTGSLAVSGQTISGVISDTGTVGTGSLAVTGQTVTATTGADATISTGTLSVAGQTVTADPAVAGTVATGGLAVSGQTVTSSTGTVATVATGSLTVAGQTVTASTGTDATVTTGSLAVSGQAVTAATGTSATISTGSLSVTGQTVAATYDTTGNVGTGALSVTGQTVTSTYGAVATVTTGNLAVDGQPVTAETGTTATVATGTLAVSGQAIVVTVDTTGSVDTGAYIVSGQAVLATTGVVAEIATGLLVITGQTITGTAGAALSSSFTYDATKIGTAFDATKLTTAFDATKLTTTFAADTLTVTYAANAIAGTYDAGEIE